MKINELLQNVNSGNLDIENMIQVKKYLPIEEKKIIAQGIIYECTERVSGTIKVNSLQRYLSYVKYMIKHHTNLEYMPEDYDELCSSGLLNSIMECFAEDAQECSRVLDLMMDDYMQESTIEFTIAKFLDNLSDIVEDLADKLNQRIESMDLSSVIPKDMDKGKLVDFLNTYVK